MQMCGAEHKAIVASFFRSFVETTKLSPAEVQSESIHSGVVPCV